MRPLPVFWPTLLTAVLVLSLWPNARAKRHARLERLGELRVDLLVMCAAGLLPLLLRGLELQALDIRWDDNAFGSMVWLILGLHTLHLLTDVADTTRADGSDVTRHGKGKRLSDAEDNAIYWDFVVTAWIPIYLLVYWLPRWVT